ncbi:hypothetical protein ACH5RR_013233 [Cinchona calisaya]|uniref:Uncharacterized protein n=1 Tax=Cinchona calisaya TaxID=153742 RepID=A0ABD3A1N3_9GENT
MDENTSSQKRCALQEVQGKTPHGEHLRANLSQRSELDGVSDEIPLIQRSRRLRKKFTSDKLSISAGDRDSSKCWKHTPCDWSPQDIANNPAKPVLNVKNLFTGIHSSNQTLDAIRKQVLLIFFLKYVATTFFFISPTCKTLLLLNAPKFFLKPGSIHFISEGTMLDGQESNGNTISGPSQFELVVRNLGKPSDLIPLSNAEKMMPVMLPTMPIFSQPVLCAPPAPSIFSVTSIVSIQHRKNSFSIGERIQ